MGLLTLEVHSYFSYMLEAMLGWGDLFYCELLARPFDLFTIFLKNEAYFKVLALRSLKYNEHLELNDRDEKVRVFSNWIMAQPDARGLSLMSYLCKAVSRLCKYPLLLRVRF